MSIYISVGGRDRFSPCFIITEIEINHSFSSDSSSYSKLDVSLLYYCPVFRIYCKLHDFVYTVQYPQCYCCVPGGQWNREGLVLSLILNGRLKHQTTSSL